MRLSEWADMDTAADFWCKISCCRWPAAPSVGRRCGRDDCERSCCLQMMRWEALRSTQVPRYLPTFIIAKCTSISSMIEECGEGERRPRCANDLMLSEDLSRSLSLSHAAHRHHPPISHTHAAHSYYRQWLPCEHCPQRPTAFYPFPHQYLINIYPDRPRLSPSICHPPPAASNQTAGRPLYQQAIPRHSQPEGKSHFSSAAQQSGAAGDAQPRSPAPSRMPI